MAPKAAPGSLSGREMELLHNFMRCLKSKPEVRHLIQTRMRIVQRLTLQTRSIWNKFSAMSGFGNVASARANIGRLLAKLSSDQETTGSQSPSKGDDGEEVAPETPATGKKKGAGRKRKGGKFSFAFHRLS